MLLKSDVQHIGLALLSKMAEDVATGASDKSDTSSKSKMAPPDPMENQRKQDLHEQQMQFNDDKHQLDLQKLQQGLQQSQESFQVKQEQGQAKIQEQQAGQEQEQAMQQEQEQAMQQQQQAMQSQQYQQNIMAKAAAMYTDELDPLNLTSPVPALALGAGMGGAAAHTVGATGEAKNYHALANKIVPEDIPAASVDVKKTNKGLWSKLKRDKGVPKKTQDQLISQIEDAYHGGAKVEFNDRASANAVKKAFKSRALQANAKRLLAGTGLGLLAGGAAYYGSQE